MKKPTFQTKRQRRRKAIRSLYGNPWDSSSSSSRRRSSSSRRSASKTSKRRVTFREPIERSASKTKSSSPSNVWRTVSSEKK
jgi:hypothetical protein